MALLAGGSVIRGHVNVTVVTFHAVVFDMSEMDLSFREKAIVTMTFKAVFQLWWITWSGCMAPKAWFVKMILVNIINTVVTVKTYGDIVGWYENALGVAGQAGSMLPVSLVKRVIRRTMTLVKDILIICQIRKSGDWIS